LSPNKGVNYDASFQNLPYRKIVWDWEKSVLRDAVMGIRHNRKFLRYLDFACGTGRILGFLEEYVDMSFGVDVSTLMLDVAKQKTRKSKLILGDITQEQIFDHDSLDLVTAFRFFLNAQPTLREEALNAIYRMLNDDGYLIFNIHMNKGCLLEILLRVYIWIKNIHNEDFVSMNTKDVRSLLDSTRFEIIDLYHYGVLPLYNENQRFLIKFIDKFERSASRIPFFQFCSRYIIYICKKRA
jgi:ubiquinone/menaquinone biosynthesis C-methylase UbiE